jgi:hypothetical protein
VKHVPPCGSLLGDYELLMELGEGAMGKVYIAKHQQQSDLVAIKVAKSEVLESVGGAAAFLAEIRTASRLDHPHIVRTYTSGASDGRPYLVMPLLEGGTLANEKNRRRHGEPARARELIIKLARAVQFAHERLILHCDLKPANILLDAIGEPKVSDFGLARAIGKPGSGYKGTVEGGTTGWMSPEQGERQPLTAASDVYGLGMILRWLLAEDPSAGKARQDAEAPAPSRGARRWPGTRRLDWELRTIIDKATQPLPAQRYQSAAEFAEDLERSRDGHPIQAEGSRFWRRTVKWVRRHRLATAAGIQALLLLLYIGLMPISVMREVRSTIRERNAFAAVAQAGAVMNELRSFATRVEAVAAAAGVRRLLSHRNVYDPPPALVEHRAGFDNLAVFELDGTLRARYPRPVTVYTNFNFAYRDYFRTVQQLADRRPGAAAHAYVSRVFYSRTDRSLHIGFAAPFFDEDDHPIGVILGTTLARSTFGAVQMNCTGNGDCMTALLGSRDRDGPSEELPDTVNIVAEPGLADGQDRVLDRATSQRVCGALDCTPRLHGQFSLPSRAQALILDDYADPVSHTRSIAALAPVGGTGLVVLVATPDSAADALTRRMIDRMKAFLWIPIISGLLLLAALGVGPTLAYIRGRRGPSAPSPAVGQRR